MLYPAALRRRSFAAPRPTFEPPPKVDGHNLFTHADWECVERSTLPASDGGGDLDSFAAFFVKCPAGQVLSGWTSAAIALEKGGVVRGHRHCRL